MHSVAEFAESAVAGMPPSVCEALADPIVRAVMAADQVDPSCVAALMRLMATLLSERPLSPVNREVLRRGDDPMRLNLVPSSKLTPEQKPLYDDMRQGIQTSFKGFVAIDPDGTLVGPWNPWLRFARYGGPVWALVKALSTSPALPRPVREVAILVTGAHFHSAYEIYAHVLVAELRGLSDDKIATIVSGQRPGDLTRPEAIAYDLAAALVSGGVLPDLAWKQGVAEFGLEGMAEFIYLVGLYCMVSVTLNGFDVPLPEHGEAI
jgi:4-carboxymuconolactone decarboxylase